MKDEKLFLETTFTIDNVNSIKDILVDNGWVFIIKNNCVQIYESEDDLEYEELMTSAYSNRLDTSLLDAFNKIKEYYERVS